VNVLWEKTGRCNSWLLHILLGVMLLSAHQSVVAAKTTSMTTDMAGREVILPDHIHRPLGAAPPLTALLYALDPELVLALNIPFSPASDGFVDPRMSTLPIIGSSMGHGRQVNPETLLQLQPDVALVWLNRFMSPGSDVIEKPFRTTGIPIVYVKLDTLEDWIAAFEYVGSLVGRAERGKQLAAYIRQSLQRVSSGLAGIGNKQQVTVYYAETADGLATDCHTSFHTEAINLAHGYNLYRCQPKTMMGQERVDMEQVMLWNPQYIVAQDSMFTRRAAADKRWQRLSAFLNQRVLTVPHLPMNWLDRPPSFMRALGIQWLANAFYPQQFPFNLKEETRHFYQLFLGVDLTDQQLAILLDSDQAIKGDE
jgi:iron complex transport system substrate-binding protein